MITIQIVQHCEKENLQKVLNSLKKITEKVRFAIELLSFIDDILEREKLLA